MVLKGTYPALRSKCTKPHQLGRANRRWLVKLLFAALCLAVGLKLCAFNVEAKAETAVMPVAEGIVVSNLKDQPEILCPDYDHFHVFRRNALSGPKCEPFASLAAYKSGLDRQFSDFRSIQFVRASGRDFDSATVLHQKRWRSAVIMETEESVGFFVPTARGWFTPLFARAIAADSCGEYRVRNMRLNVASLGILKGFHRISGGISRLNSSFSSSPALPIRSAEKTYSNGSQESLADTEYNKPPIPVSHRFLGFKVGYFAAFLALFSSLIAGLFVGVCLHGILEKRAEGFWRYRWWGFAGGLFTGAAFGSLFILLAAYAQR